MSDMLDAAIRYAQLGLAVVPLNGKIPVFRNWPEVATRDQVMISRWWKQNPRANIGIATGHKSDIFVVDIDPRHGGRQSWDDELLSRGKAPNTWQDITGGGGLHIFFRYPNFAVKNAQGILPGVDIRGDGGQVVAPPSIHPDTHQSYEWDGPEPIDRQSLAEAPQWLLDLLSPAPISLDKKSLSEVPVKIPHGVQHQTLVSLAGMMRRLGLTDREIYPSLMEVNEQRCEKPGSAENIHQIAHSMMKYAPGDAQLYRVASKLWRMTAAIEHKQQKVIESMGAIDGYTLMKKDLPPADVIIESCLHSGCTILAGAPKSGKSWLVLGMAIAVASGGRFMGSQNVLRPGKVAYWAIEETPVRTAGRLKTLMELPQIQMQNIEFMYDLKPMFSGGLDAIAIYLEKNRPEMVIIDTLMAFVTGDRASRSDVFRDDYREIKALTDLAHQFETAIVVVHHTNKMGGGGIQSVAGTHGVTAAADCIWTLTKQPERRAVLEMQGREIEQQAFLIELELKEPIGWHVIEQGEDVVMTGERQLIIEVLRESGPKTPKALAAEIGKNQMATRQLLYRMVKRGMVIREINGTYRIPSEPQQHWNERDGGNG